MKERPILFSGPMVRAILARKKTQTRRVVKAHKWSDAKHAGVDFPCPYGADGDRLWVREKFCMAADGHVHYAATDQALGPWKPSIHMPRWASRITLEITGVSVEQLQDISEGDAEAEGTTPYTAPAEMPAYKPAFADLWDSINAKRGYGWDANCWVWVLTFNLISVK